MYTFAGRSLINQLLIYSRDRSSFESSLKNWAGFCRILACVKEPGFWVMSIC
ncbi:MAG: hypothetical protein NHB32_06165 [Fischerella sp. CENA71]|nr:hypothetical protein [Fischerella sp. CENA71]